MKKIKALPSSLALLALAFMAGCAGQPEVTTLADGSVAYRIDCGRNSGGLNFCFEKAGKSCGAEGFTIYDREGRVISEGSATSGDAQIVTNTPGSSSNKNSILIRCGES